MTTTTTATRSLLRIADLDADELLHVLDLAEAMKQRPAGWLTTLAAQTVACYFTKPSTRTRASFETAVARLGGVPMMLRPDELQLGRGEPIADTARVLSSYSAAIVIRTFAQSDVEQVARFSSVPVINALTDDHHPCQALADLLTLRERFGSLDGLRVAYLGDGNNVAHSLMEACALLGVDIAVATPAALEPAPEVVDRARATSARSGSSVLVTEDPCAAVRGAHAVYTDVWVSMGEDAERQRRLGLLRPFQVDAALMARAHAEAIFMHCLPAHRGEEVTADVIDGPRSVVWQQAANRLPTEQALLHALVSGEV